MDREELIKKTIMLGAKYGTLTLNIVKNGLNIDEITAKNILDLMVAEDYLIDFDYEGDDMGLLDFEAISGLFRDTENRKETFEFLCEYFDNIEVDESLKPSNNIDTIPLTEELKMKIIDWAKKQDRIGLNLIEKEFTVNIYTAVEIIDFLIKEKMIVKNNLSYDVIK